MFSKIYLLSEGGRKTVCRTPYGGKKTMWIYSNIHALYLSGRPLKKVLTLVAENLLARGSHKLFAAFEF